jgi:hypothetical protein
MVCTPARYRMHRIDHGSAYRLPGGVHRNGAKEEFFSRLRRAEIGHHHQIAGGGPGTRRRRSLPSSVSDICQCCQLPIMPPTAQGSGGRMCAQVTAVKLAPALFPLSHWMAQGDFSLAATRHRQFAIC